jgi:hypothetical protein
MNPETIAFPIATASSRSSSRPSSEELVSFVEELTALLDRAEARLGPEAPALTSLEKRRAVKPRKGAERILGLLGPIVAQRSLETGVLTSAGMLGLLAEADTLKPLEVRIEKFHKRVSDELFTRRVEAWRMGLQLYALCRNRALWDGELRACLAPLTAIFAHRHPHVKGAKPTKLQVRAKAKLAEAIAFAQRNGVTLGGAEEGTVT